MRKAKAKAEAEAEAWAAVGTRAGALIGGGILLVVMLGVPDTTMAQARDRWTAGAMDFVRLLDEEKFDSAAARISGAVPADALSPERLGLIWAQVMAASGPLGEVIPQSVTEQNRQHIVDLEARFERQPLKIRVVLDDALELTGLWFLPPEPPPYDVPAYTDTSAIREIDLTVGTDPWTLPGTLTVPDSPGSHPVVVLVHGSGPHDRDETIGPNRPFRDIAGGLATRGIAVLRYEKRTKVHGPRIEAEGFTVEQEVIEDALAAITAARSHQDIDADRVYLAGHSLGAMLAPDIARRDERLAGIILLAAPARPLEVILRDQLEYIASLPQSDSAARASITASLDTLARLEDRALPPDAQVMGAPASYYYDLDEYRPVDSAAMLDIPILIVHGGRDYQVTGEDLAIWRDRLQGENVTIREFPALNHLFIEGSGTATPTEYYSLAGHVAATVIETIANWIGKTR